MFFRPILDVRAYAAVVYHTSYAHEHAAVYVHERVSKIIAYHG